MFSFLFRFYCDDNKWKNYNSGSLWNSLAEEIFRNLNFVTLVHQTQRTNDRTGIRGPVGEWPTTSQREGRRNYSSWRTAQKRYLAAQKTLSCCLPQNTNNFIHIKAYVGVRMGGGGQIPLQHCMSEAKTRQLLLTIMYGDRHRLTAQEVSLRQCMCTKSNAGVFARSWRMAVLVFSISNTSQSDTTVGVRLCFFIGFTCQEPLISPKKRLYEICESTSPLAIQWAGDTPNDLENGNVPTHLLLLVTLGNPEWEDLVAKYATPTIAALRRRNGCLRVAICTFSFLFAIQSRVSTAAPAEIWDNHPQSG